jgi:DNA-binding transcriptional ArsR family regulator
VGDDGAAPRRHDADHSRRDRLTIDAKAKLEALDAVCDAIAHPARRQILLTVHLRGAMTAGDIAGRFEHAWPTTTRHLRVLVDAGLLRHERQGRNHLYSVDHARLELMKEWLGWFERPPG